MSEVTHIVLGYSNRGWRAHVAVLAAAGIVPLLLAILLRDASDAVGLGIFVLMLALTFTARRLGCADMMFAPTHVSIRPWGIFGPKLVIEYRALRSTSIQPSHPTPTLIVETNQGEAYLLGPFDFFSLHGCRKRVEDAARLLSEGAGANAT